MMRALLVVFFLGAILGAATVKIWREKGVVVEVGRGWLRLNGEPVSAAALTAGIEKTARKYPPTTTTYLRDGKMLLFIHRNACWEDVTVALDALSLTRFLFLRIFWFHPDLKATTPFLLPLGACTSPPMWWDIEGNAHLGFPPENSYQLYVRLKREGNTVTADFGKHPILLRSERDWGVVRGFLKRITTQSEDQPIFVRVHSEPDVAAGVVLRLLETLRSFSSRIVNITLLSADSLPIIELGN